MHLSAMLCTMQINLMQQWVSVDIQQLQQKRHLPSNEESCLYNIQLFQQNCRILSIQAWKTHSNLALWKTVLKLISANPFMSVSRKRRLLKFQLNAVILKEEVCSPVLAILRGTGPTYAPFCSQQCYLP